MAISTDLPRPLLKAFQRAFPGQTPDVFVRAPGRVNLLGGHVDMHGGTVINIAINREIWLAAAYGAANLVSLHAADLEASATFPLARLDERVDVVGETLPRWTHYPAGVAWILQRRGLKVNGINAAFLGNVLMRAGLSSSAAVEVAFAIAWQALEGWRLEPADLALVGNEVEREYLGIGSGIQDQFTCLHARNNHALWLDCRSMEYRLPPFPTEARVVICDTNTRRELIGSNYNTRAKEGHAAARTMSLIDSSIKTLRDVTPERLEEYRGVLSEGEYFRARHVVNEITRVTEGFEALGKRDVAAFGDLMNRSYWSARDDYGSSSPALDAMWQAATQHPACYGARYSGGGEAGAAVALVAADAVEEFMAHTRREYERLSSHTANIFVAEPADAAGVYG
jgi:galactokinase